MRSSSARLVLELPAGETEILLRCNATPELAAAGQRLTLRSEADTLADVAVPAWGSEARLHARFTQARAGSRELQLSAAVLHDDRAVYLRGLQLRSTGDPEEPDALEGWEAWTTAKSAPGTPAPDSSPDLLLLLLDAARADHFGCYGYERATTPNVDRLADEGVILRRAHADASFTRSSLPSLFTGSSWLQHGVFAPGSTLPPELPTLAQLLSNAGYHTLGITTNPEAATASGLDRGFDEYFETWRHPERARIARSGLYEIPATLFAELVGEQPNSQPLFAFVHVVPPHQPYEPTTEHDLWRAADAPDWDIVRNKLLSDVDEGRRVLDAAERQRTIDLYDGNLHRADAIVASILDAHRSARAGRPLCVVVLSDHGEAFGEHGRYRHSSTVHEEMTRIPLLFWPRERFGSLAVREHELTALSDVLPLLLHALALSLPQGVSFPRHLLRLHEDPSWSRPGIWLLANGEIGYRDDESLRIVRRFAAPERWVDGTLRADGAPWFGSMVWTLRRLRVPHASAGIAVPSAADEEELRALGYVD